MHQYPVAIGCPQAPQLVQTAHHAGCPGRATAVSHLQAGRQAREAGQGLVTGRDDHQHGGQARDLRKSVQGVRHQRLAGYALVLLGDIRARTAAAARAGNEGVQPDRRARRGSHG